MGGCCDDVWGCLGRVVLFMFMMCCGGRVTWCLVSAGLEGELGYCGVVLVMGGGFAGFLWWCSLSVLGVLWSCCGVLGMFWGVLVVFWVFWVFWCSGVLACSGCVLGVFWGVLGCSCGFLSLFCWSSCLFPWCSWHFLWLFWVCFDVLGIFWYVCFLV